MVRNYGVAGCTFLISLLMLFAAVGDEVGEGESAKRAAKLAAKEAQRYEILAGPSKTAAELSGGALLHWSNPLDSVHGAVFCWLAEDRPAAIVSIYKYFTGDKKFSAEFQSLYPGRISVKRDGVERWNPRSSGVVFKPIRGVVPGRTLAQQTLQMRQISRRFSAETKSWDTGEPRKLRLLPQPILTYGAQDRSFAGGVFSFVIATDPDVLLLIETTKVDGQPAWQYGLARLSINETKVRFDDEVVWTVPLQESPFERPQESYTILQAIDEPEL